MNQDNPSLHAFPYDPFQQRAIDAIDRGLSVFVAAPTGAGKTVIADYVIATALARDQQVIYTAPVKALSNQKFRDFTAREGERARRGERVPDADKHPAESVGIMTGDVTINPKAPLLIMTTEIYRNTLLENPRRLERCAWVIFDEIHYLDDPERGTVWEEAIMFTPTHTNILALSATIPNVEQIASWIRDVHERPVEVIVETERPVPLHVLFQSQNKIMKNQAELKHEGFRDREDWGQAQRRHVGRGRRRFEDERWVVRQNRMDTLVQHLQETDRMPTIFFTFGRRRAEDLAWEASGFINMDPAHKKKLRTLYDELCARFGITNDHTAQAMAQLIDRGVAYHHAGMLPTIKEVVERCFVSRLVKFIVTTETFALGINMPARSVTIDTIKKRIGGRFDIIRSRSWSQMAGRAGRRGLDPEGFVYLRVNPTQVTYQEVMKVLHNQPEPVLSRFNTAYATLLNLSRRHGQKILDIYPKTLYYFQTTGTRRDNGLSLMQRKLELLQELGYLADSHLTEKGEFGSYLYGYELLLTELHEQGLLESLDAPGLAILLVAAVYEARPGLTLPKSNAISKRLEKLCEAPLARIHRVESRLRIHPLSKAPHFQLSAAMEAWYHNAPFIRLTKLCDVDEGEIVRYFRMTVQLLRQLIDAPAVDELLRKKAYIALSKINRDVVDAEQQLRMGTD